jgi:hypothetical protein
MKQTLLAMSMIALLAGCASRHLAPRCKGGYTPINQRVSGGVNGQQSGG